jgi:hypothetical protein
MGNDGALRGPRPILQGMRRIWWLAAVLAAFAVPAAVGAWTPVGGTGRPSARLLADPAHPGTLYVLVATGEASSPAALWKTTDGGAHWFSIQKGLGTPPNLLALDPRQPSRLYTSDDSGLTPRRLPAEDEGRRETVPRIHSLTSTLVPAKVKIYERSILQLHLPAVAVLGSRAGFRL